MSSPESRRQPEIMALQEGAQDCAARLSRICRAPWSVECLVPGIEASKSFEDLLSGVFEDRFGSYLSTQGASFLVIFDRKSGLRVFTRFTGDYGETVNAIDSLELQALGEVSNVMVNALTQSLATAGCRPLLLKAPEPLVESSRELLRAAFSKIKHPADAALAYYLRLKCAELSCSAEIIVLLEKSLLEQLKASPA